VGTSAQSSSGVRIRARPLEIGNTEETSIESNDLQTRTEGASPLDLAEVVNGKTGEEQNLLVVLVRGPVHQPSQQEVGELQAMLPGAGRQEDGQEVKDAARHDKTTMIRVQQLSDRDDLLGGGVCICEHGIP
jgi:hypothetical protein